MHTSGAGNQSKIAGLTIALTLATLWLLMRGYHGLTGDAQLYAFQALARIRPLLSADLYLQNTSQDQFTVFSPIYAWFITWLGLESAARLLTVVFTIWMFAAVWSLARAISSRTAAWLAVALLLIVAGDYGGSGVFRISEQFLTARLPAQALIITALACQIRGRWQVGLLLAIMALLVHPLMALPGLLLMICMKLSIRVSVLGAVAGLALVLAIALAACTLPALHGRSNLMDEPWVEVVSERSQFLFLTLWSARDWGLNVQPFFYLAFTAIVVSDGRIRKLCLAAALVGVAGLALAQIGSSIGPVTILVQGQAWRWVWITVLVSALVLPVTASQVWQDQKCGPLCVLLLISGWTVPPADGTACVSIALLLWLARDHINARVATLFRWLAAALGIAIVTWMFIKTLAIFVSTSAHSGNEILEAASLRDFFGLRIPAVLFVALVWWWMRTCRTIGLTTLCATLVSLSIFVLPAAFKQSRTLAAASDIEEFSDWAVAIPPTSTVLVTPPRDVGTFVWFTLNRQNYLTVNQSAGVVFSRATALEVVRRSDVLLPLMDPNWKVKSGLRLTYARHNTEATARPLTAQSLLQVCSDTTLGFVASRIDVGIEHLHHNHAGAWKDWNLYDCSKIRPALPAT